MWPTLYGAPDEAAPCCWCSSLVMVDVHHHFGAFHSSEWSRRGEVIKATTTRTGCRKVEKLISFRQLLADWGRFSPTSTTWSGNGIQISWSCGTPSPAAAGTAATSHTWWTRVTRQQRLNRKRNALTEILLWFPPKTSGSSIVFHLNTAFNRRRCAGGTFIEIQYRVGVAGNTRKSL